MTPARKKALQWFYDRGEVRRSDISRMDRSHARSLYRPSPRMVHMLERDSLIISRGLADIITLTDKGRQALHGGDV